ncbi:MAG: dihydroneopterin aldolase, partial [Flavobacteriales bacterium]|nr:dihydroneopterin aldolase [Flavobacteriales bacterium]
MARITLTGMEFFSHHGYYDDEITRGNKFVIDLNIDVDTSAASASDDLEEALNYEVVYELIKSEMAIRSNLLEHVAKRMVDRIKKEFPEIEELELTIA